MSEIHGLLADPDTRWVVVLIAAGFAAAVTGLAVSAWDLRIVRKLGERAGFAAGILQAELDERTAERDRARDIAVALEQEIAGAQINYRHAVERHEAENEQLRNRVAELQGLMADAAMWSIHRYRQWIAEGTPPERAERAVAREASQRREEVA